MLVIFERDGIRLKSYGNGLAYALEQTLTQRGAYFQGDDATHFREEWEAFEATHPAGDLVAYFSEILSQYAEEEQ